MYNLNPLKINILNTHMKDWKMNFLLNWVSFGFQPLIFSGVTTPHQKKA